MTTRTTLSSTSIRDKLQVAPTTSVSMPILGSSPSEPELGTRAILKIYKVKIPQELLDAAKQELISKQGSNMTKFTPKNKGFIAEYPETAKLADVLAAELLEKTHTDLSFIRATNKSNHIFADNLHFDSRYVGYSKRRNIRGSFWRPGTSVEIWRQLINLDNQPRHLPIIDTPISALQQRGIDIYSERPVGKQFTHYHQPDDIPRRLLTRKIPSEASRICTIPAYDGENPAVLEVWSSRVLHAGITSRDGQLVAAAAKWVPTNKRDGKGYYA